MCSVTRLRANFKLSCVLYVLYDLFFCLCYALSHKESFSESMNAKVGTFLSQDPPMVVLSITGYSQSSYGSTLKLGQHFKNADQFKDELCSNTTKQNSDFIFIKNNKIQVTVRCAISDCPWFIHASKEGNIDTFWERTIQGMHDCIGGIGTTAHPKASKKCVYHHVIKKLKEQPLYRAVDIQKDILREHGVCFPYKRAWMGNEVAKVSIHGSKVSSYNLLLWYTDKVAKTNPGSVVAIENDGERLKSDFFSFRACLLGFKQSCRPLLFLDGTH